MDGSMALKQATLDEIQSKLGPVAEVLIAKVYAAERDELRSKFGPFHGRRRG